MISTSQELKPIKDLPNVPAIENMEDTDEFLIVNNNAIKKVAGSNSTERKISSVKTYDLSSADATMNGLECAYNIIELAGTLTANRTFNFYLDTTRLYGRKKYTIKMSATGFFFIIIKTNISNSKQVILNTNSNPYLLDVYIDENGNIYDSRVMVPKISTGLIMGDSTIAAYLGQSGIDAFLYTGADAVSGSAIYNQAVPGQNAQQQKAVWVADTNKTRYDWIIIQIGLNDINPAVTSASIIASIQDLVDTIIQGKKPSAIIIMSAMLLCKARWVSTWGAVDGETAYQQQLTVNNAIMGVGGGIYNVDYRVNKHVNMLSDVNGYLTANYNLGDGIHENEAGRKIIAAGWRHILNNAGYYLHNIPSATTESTEFSDSGDYIPTITPVLNTASVNPHITQWLKIGNKIYVSGILEAQLISGSINTAFAVSLPIASNFTSIDDCSGSSKSSQTSGGFMVYADVTYNVATFECNDIPSTSNILWAFSFMYTIK